MKIHFVLLLYSVRRLLFVTATAAGTQLAIASTRTDERSDNVQLMDSPEDDRMTPENINPFRGKHLLVLINWVFISFYLNNRYI